MGRTCQNAQVRVIRLNDTILLVCRVYLDGTAADKFQ